MKVVSIARRPQSPPWTLLPYTFSAQNHSFNSIVLSLSALECRVSPLRSSHRPNSLGASRIQCLTSGLLACVPPFRQRVFPLLRQIQETGGLGAERLACVGTVIVAGGIVVVFESHAHSMAIDEPDVVVFSRQGIRVASGHQCQARPRAGSCWAQQCSQAWGSCACVFDSRPSGGPRSSIGRSGINQSATASEGLEERSILGVWSIWHSSLTNSE